MFEYTTFEDYLEEGIAEACHWIGYKKLIKSLPLDDDALEEGLDLLRIFVNHRASLYRHREELAELKLSKAKADVDGKTTEVVILGNREQKIKEKAVIVIWKILEQRVPFDDWKAMEYVDARPRKGASDYADD